MPYELIEQGYLVKPSYFSITQADLEKVGVVNDGDFDEAELALVFNTGEMIQDAVRHWKRLAYGRANASKINKTKWTKSLVHASSARISFSVNLIVSSVDGS